MDDEWKEFLLVWSIILIVIGVVTFYLKKLYFLKVHSFIAQIGGTSLSVSIFWVGWIGFLLFLYTWYVNKL